MILKNVTDSQLRAFQCYSINSKDSYNVILLFFGQKLLSSICIYKHEEYSIMSGNDGCGKSKHIKLSKTTMNMQENKLP